MAARATGVLPWRWRWLWGRRWAAGCTCPPVAARTAAGTIAAYSSSSAPAVLARTRTTLNVPYRRHRKASVGASRLLSRPPPDRVAVGSSAKGPGRRREGEPRAVRAGHLVRPQTVSRQVKRRMILSGSNPRPPPAFPPSGSPKPVGWDRRSALRLDLFQARTRALAPTRPRR